LGEQRSQWEKDRLQPGRKGRGERLQPTHERVRGKETTPIKADWGINREISKQKKMKIKGRSERGNWY
jgi:hypothetical protein